MTVIKFIFWTLCGRLLYGSLFLPLNKKLKKVIATFYLTILTFFLAISTLQEKSQTNSEKKRQNCEIKVAITFFIFYSVAETGFHVIESLGIKIKGLGCCRHQLFLSGFV